MLMIGKLLMDEQGRLGVRRVPSLESGAAKVEQTFEAIGTFHEVRYGNIGTCWSIIRPDGTIYAEWQGGLRTVANDTAVWRGVSVGTYVVGPEHSRTFRGSLTIENAKGALAELNGVLAVFELNIDDQGKVRNRTWNLMSSDG